MQISYEKVYTYPMGDIEDNSINNWRTFGIIWKIIHLIWRDAVATHGFCPSKTEIETKRYDNNIYY
jgi:hypothetical protein